MWAFIYEHSYMVNHMWTCRRYIWAYRYILARRCHDMAKQMYSNRKWASKAWAALKEWVYGTPALTSLRLTRLTSFNKDDGDLHVVVAKCLWKLATQANLPWGRAASRPTGYSNVPDTEKVLNVGIPSRLVFFFFSHSHMSHSYMNMRTW
jgi:hypothetical protein